MIPNKKPAKGLQHNSYEKILFPYLDFPLLALQATSSGFGTASIRRHYTSAGSPTNGMRSKPKRRRMRILVARIE
jgi:hypothetical protein